MLDIIFQILPVLGIILLVSLCVIFVFLLLVLFFPVSYKVSGKKDTEAFFLSARVNWLLGLLRIRYAYPEPGRLTVKLLWIMLYDSKAVEHKEKTTEKEKNKTKKVSQTAADNTENTAGTHDTNNANSTGSADNADYAENTEESQYSETSPKVQSQESSKSHAGDDGQGSNRVFQKIEKIKFTICSTYDKIKKIWENITYYVFLLQEEETHQLLSHVMGRVKSIFRNIRPRKLKVSILFGTGAPDTTGYAFGVYGMFSPVLGPGVIVTPDFERAVLEGDFYAAGTITSVILVWHFLKVIIDKKFWRFIDKLKTGRKPVDTSAREPADTFDTEIREEYIKNAL